MKIKNKQDVINWLKRLKEDHPLSTARCQLVKGRTFINGRADVYTDQVIEKRYQGMIDYLESEEVE